MLASGKGVLFIHDSVFRRDMAIAKQLRRNNCDEKTTGDKPNIFHVDMFNKQLKLTLPLVLGLALCAFSTKALSSENQRNVHISFAGAYNLPDDSTLQNASMYHFQIASSIGSFQVGIEAAGQYHAPADYRYRVPYRSLSETRELNILSGLLILRLMPWHHGILSPYVGGFFGGSYVYDMAPNSSYFDDKVSSDKVLVAGPALGFELLPGGFISIFVEARKLFQVMGHLQRPEIIKVDSFGKVTQTNHEYNIEATSITAGFRFNF